VKRNLVSLLLVLLIQAALVAAVYWPGPDPEYAPPAPLLPFAASGVDTIVVGDEFDNETVLAKAGDRWLLPELKNLPADVSMVNKLLEALSASEGSWPVANSAAARQRFRVAGYHYRRRISLAQGEEVLGTFFLGSSPGFRKVYARNEAQSGIYSVLFNAQDAPGYSGGWLDKNLLQTRAPLSVSADTYSVRREDGGWRSAIGQIPEERQPEALPATLTGP